MVVSDRLLTALGSYIEEQAAVGLRPVLRDWSGTKGKEQLVLDADEPEEHEGLNGVYAVDGVVAVMVHARDMDDEERREVLGAIDTALSLEGSDEGEIKVAEWCSDASEARGIGSEVLKVFEFRHDAGAWEVDGKWLVGRIEWAAICCGG